MRTTTLRMSSVLVASLAALVLLSSSPCAGQATDPRLVVFEDFMRPT